MKLKYIKQQFQIDAVNAAAELFRGQAGAPSVFGVSKKDLMDYQAGGADLLGYGNALTIDKAQMQVNMNAVQETNLLPLTVLPKAECPRQSIGCPLNTDDLMRCVECVEHKKELEEKRDTKTPIELCPLHSAPRFNIEMETGTGKTFVYIKTIFELNKLYDFNKFVILVPSVAIREGVFHSFKAMESHFASEYDGKRAHYFAYNSKKINEVRDFALSSTIEVMIVTIDSINKDTNLFVKESDRMDKTAREFMTECRPIVILDEPQSLDNTSLARAAIKNNLNPLVELRYSATHKEKVNTIYRLTPVDAYEKKIVKQICIASDSVADGFNKPYIRLVEVGKKSGFFARLELDVKNSSGLTERKIMTVNADADLAEVTKREIYEGYKIEGIDCTAGRESIEFTMHPPLEVGGIIGGIDEIVLKREQIRNTIQIHLEKELRYLAKGIKVLSLFFIDEVARYRIHNVGDGKGMTYSSGIYATIFEEEYEKLIALPKFAAIKEKFPEAPSDVHDGYFSKDKKGALKNTKGDTADDSDTYALIMQKKEELLSFTTPLRFIFSHSALKEGWDNPNVFQICTLIEQRTPFTCRQKIGRGLRLCVDQTGERIEDESINILHVISNEGFAEFAAKLQTEIEELGVKFGILDIGMFVNISYKDDGTTATDGTAADNGGAIEATEHKQITHADATEILKHFREKGYTDASGKMKQTLKEALAKGEVDLPARFEAARERIIPILLAADKKVEIKPYKKQVSIKRKDDIFTSPEFTAIWDKMKYKTIFRMDLDIPLLHEKCIERIKAMDEIKPVRIRKEEARLDIAKAGVSFEETRQRFTEAEQEFLLPDVVATVAMGCKMPRREVGEILRAAARWADFVNNPQSFTEAVTKIINDTKVEVMMEDGVKYTKLDDQEFTWYEVFNIASETDAFAFLDHNAVEVQNSVYDHVVYDSQVESRFARALDVDTDVKLFFKIPPRFKISTPIGTYNPDWAVYYEGADGEKRLYFVIETKGTTDERGLTSNVNFKNACGAAHFAAIGTGIDYQVATEWRSVKKG